MVSLQGKPSLSMEEGCKNHKCEMASDLTVSNVQKLSEVHCKCLRGITGSLQVFPVMGKPCNIYRLWGNPIIVMGFPSNL